MDGPKGHLIRAYLDTAQMTLNSTIEDRQKRLRDSDVQTFRLAIACLEPFLWYL